MSLGLLESKLPDPKAAEPIVRLLYQHGNTTADQVPVIAAALAAFSLGLTFNGTMLMLNRGFFSLQSNWVPTVVALGNLGLNAVLDAAFYSFGTWGIPLSTSLVNIAGTAALLVLLRRRLGRIELGEKSVERDSLDPLQDGIRWNAVGSRLDVEDVRNGHGTAHQVHHRSLPHGGGVVLNEACLNKYLSEKGIFNDLV